MNKKSKNIKNHFFKRCLQRTGYLINHKELVNKIQNQKLEFIHRTSNSRTLFKYHFDLDNKDYVVVYDKNRHDVVTLYEYKERKRRKKNNVKKI